MRMCVWWLPAATSNSTLALIDTSPRFCQSRLEQTLDAHGVLDFTVERALYDRTNESLSVDRFAG
jgi:hypothetical protein